MNRVRYIKSLSAFLLFLCAAPGCAWYEKTASQQRQPRQGTSNTVIVQGPKGKIPLEVKKPEGENLALATSPQRTASLEVVTQGRGQLERGDRERAVQSFQEAITLDGTNGIAYYYLARTHYELGQSEQAMGLLERAESLLADADDWLVSIEALRETIRTRVITKT